MIIIPIITPMMIIITIVTPMIMITDNYTDDDYNKQNIKRNSKWYI